MLINAQAHNQDSMITGSSTEGVGRLHFEKFSNRSNKKLPLETVTQLL